jgi:hypothetical protein
LITFRGHIGFEKVQLRAAIVRKIEASGLCGAQRPF